jgi:hypothetical protein
MSGSRLHDQWTDALPAFAADTELSGSHVNNLWNGVHFIMTIRAAWAPTWGVQEVMDACVQQLASLPAYRSGVASVVSRVAKAYSGVEIPRSVNRAYLQFFLPFWWEHILERGPLDDNTAEKQVALILKPATPPAPTPLRRYLSRRPRRQPNILGPTRQHGSSTTRCRLPRRRSSLRALRPADHPPTPRRPRPTKGTPLQPFVGKPVSALIIGKNFGVETPLTDKHCACAVSRHYPTRSHRTFECPLRYWALR